MRPGRQAKRGEHQPEREKGAQGAKRSWQPVGTGTSPKLPHGSARRDRQAGWTFRVNPPSRGSFLLRGVGDLERKRKAYRVRRVRVKRGGRTVVRRKRSSGAGSPPSAPRRSRAPGSAA